MVIAGYRITPYRLPLTRPWTTARGTLEERSGWLLELETDEGLRGWGDCAPLEDSGTESAERAIEALEREAPQLTGLPVTAAVEAIRAEATPAARCALETAVLDLLARSRGIPLARYINGKAAGRIRVNAVAGMLDAGARERARAAERDGYGVIKFKVGVDPLERELEILRDVAEGLSADTRLRLDANRAWDEPTARRFLVEARELPVESVEEPLRRPEPDLLKRLQTGVPFPLALDESLPLLGVHAICKQRAVARLVLKPTVLGGPMAAFRTAHSAFQCGLQCVVTTTLESAAGHWAAMQLAAAVHALEGRDLAHGLATGTWLAKDVGTAPEPRGGVLEVPDAAGLGMTFARPV